MSINVEKKEELSLPINIEKKIEVWKNKLLDLGKRNRLINYKETKSSTLHIVTPEMYDLWESFVKEERPLEFPCDEEIEDDEYFHYEEIETNQDIKDMQKTLRNLRNKAKIAIEEQGINVLFLAFGFLEWSESKDSSQFLRSPLILVPVSLSVESISSPYILSLHEDEIILNPTLQYKLENDFGIVLPEFNEENELSEYFEEIRKLVSRNKWQIIEDTGLSLFSFLKINMYNDLSKYKDRIAKNPIVRAISGEPLEFSHITDELQNYDFDLNNKPKDVFQVVDADSSQQDAILFAKKGISFVLQGPPGTGKSQTITNIISECLADGKKILFVSEKMAALDVVYRRLTSAGLNDFCLVMHSHKANKKNIMEQLEYLLKLAKNKAELNDETYLKLEMLEKDREKLNRYTNELFQKVEPLGKSIYQVNGIIANLRQYKDVVFPIEDIDNTDLSKYNRYIYSLQELKNCIGKMSYGHNDNPWRNTKIKILTNELRHDIGAKMTKLIEKLGYYRQEFKNIKNSVFLNLHESYSTMHETIEIFKIAKNSPIIPVNWILGNEIKQLFTEISECEIFKKSFLLKREDLSERYTRLTSLDSNLNLSRIDSLQLHNDIQEEILQLEEYLKKDITFSNIDLLGDYEKLILEKIQALEKYNIIKQAKEKILNSFEKEIFNIEYMPILGRYRNYSAIFKYFNSSYWSDKKQLRSLYKNMSLKFNDDIALSTLNLLKEMSDAKDWFKENCSCLKKIFSKDFNYENLNFENMERKLSIYVELKESIFDLKKMHEISLQFYKREDVLKQNYSFLYCGLDTSWEGIRDALTWGIDFRKLVGEKNINEEFVEKICSDKGIVEICKINEQQIINFIEDIDIELEWVSELFDNADTFKEMEISKLIERLESCRNGLFLLEEWIDFRNAKNSCQKDGLGEYVKKVEEENIDPNCILPIFKKRFFRLWLDAVLPSYPSVLNFRRVNQENTINSFATLDKMQLEIAKARIKEKLINRLPSFEHFTNGGDERSILQHEFGKRRKIMSIRKLFKKIPNLLPSLKPCLMMSPLSVSLFLEAETYQFDIVIFDEASQVCTENAIGAISRGKQVIIAGDSKQLPPTNFFGASLSESDYDIDDDDLDDGYAYESILDEAKMLPERTLSWHYRSKHEHLIAFSNAKIYKNNLITFPSNFDKVRDNGVEYEYVKEGFYDRGGKKGNVIEAKRVAEIVFEHFRNYPNRSIGVIAFGEVQQEAIDTVIRKMRMENQTFENFFNEDKEEPFFVKNLENVQGDERDTIIFSIGYAKDINGVFRMNFGPLSKSGGERRLNVAITRAKFNVKLVGSILPTDINIDKITSDGPKLLRAYIDFAINGMESIERENIASDIIEHDSPFEKAVYDFLENKGYKLKTQVGCSGYRIDMAVKHPDLSGIYVIGIECDGATYHSARTARERDRLRQDVLEQMGWKIYRIWSTDWIKDPATEGMKLVEAIEEAIKNNTFTYERKENDNMPKAEDFVSIEEKIILTEEKGNLYGFPEEDNVVFEGEFQNPTDFIVEVVNKKFPIHYDLLCKEVAPIFGNEKATIKVKREVDFQLKKLKSKIERKGDFIFKANYEKVYPRCFNNRKIDHVSKEELSEAMMYVIEKSVGATKERICVETARAYNYNRITNNIDLALNDAFTMLLNEKRIMILEGKVSKK